MSAKKIILYMCDRVVIGGGPTHPFFIQVLQQY
jgi:hypothetical protein